MSWLGTLVALARAGRTTLIPDPAAARGQHQTVEMHQAQPPAHRERPAAVPAQQQLHQTRPHGAALVVAPEATVQPGLRLVAPTKDAAAVAAAVASLAAIRPMPAAHPGFLLQERQCRLLEEPLGLASPRQPLLRQGQSGAVEAALAGHRM